VFTSCDGPTSSAPVTGSISGRAFFSDSTNHEGITITLGRTDGLRSVAALDQARSIASGAGATGRSVLVARTQTAADGSYTFTNIPPGIYTIYASSPHSRERAVAINNVVVTSAGGTITASDLNLTPVGYISGRIKLDGNESGNAGFLVAVAGTSWMAVTADDGSFVISDVPAGSNYLLLIMRGLFTTLWTSAPQRVVVGDVTVLYPNPRILSSADIGGVGIAWQGSFISAEALIAHMGRQPELNWAFFSTTTRTSYIWNGSAWNILAAPGGDGAPGATPRIEDGYWWIGTTNTGIRAEGTPGTPGAPGNDGQTPRIEDGYWWIGTTKFTAALTFYAGLIPGLATVLLFQMYWPFLVDTVVSPFIIVSIVEVIIIWRLRPDTGTAWPGLRGKRAFAESINICAGLMLLYIAVSVSASVSGGLIDYIRFTRVEMYRRFFTPNDVFRFAFYGSGFHPLAVAILSRFPINLIDRFIVIAGGFSIAVGMGKIGDKLRMNREQRERVRGMSREHVK